MSFLHKSYQEFFAALFIACGNDSACSSMLQSLKCLDDVFEMSEVLMFLSGLRPDLISIVSSHIAELADRDENIVSYRNTLRNYTDLVGFLRIISVQNTISRCIEEGIARERLYIELHDIDTYKYSINGVDSIHPYLKVEDVKSFDKSGCKTKLNLQNLVRVCLRPYAGDKSHYIKPLEPHDHVVGIIEDSQTTLTYFRLDERSDLCNVNSVLQQANKVRHLELADFRSLNLSHKEMEDLVRFLSHNTQLKEITLKMIVCTTCERQCSSRIDLFNHQSLKSLHVWNVNVVIIPSDRKTLQEYLLYWMPTKCMTSCIDSLRSSPSLQKIKVGNPLYDSISKNECSTTPPSVHNMEDVRLSSLALPKVLTDVIPTLHNLRLLDLERIDFTQELLRLSPEMTQLGTVFLSWVKMTFQSLQYFCNSFSRIHHTIHVSVLEMYLVSNDDAFAALNYITDRFHVTSTGVNKDGYLTIKFDTHAS